MDEASNHRILDAGGEISPELAHAVARRVFRIDFQEPGFCVVAFPEEMNSHEFRRCMVALKEALSDIYREQFGESLVYQSMGRFDQQNTTRLHLDGGPERSFLMLGYEPSRVGSVFHVADYSRCASDRDLTPQEFLAAHNPMRSGNQELLADYLTSVCDWEEHRPRIVVINNSATAPGDPLHTPGVLHGASIAQPNSECTRVINSTMVVPESLAQEGRGIADMERKFLQTEQIAGEIMR